MSTGKFVIEKRHDHYALYSVVPTNFGGEAKNFIRKAEHISVLKDTVAQLRQSYCYEHFDLEYKYDK